MTKDVSETIENGSKEQKGGFLGISLGTLSASLLGNLLTGKGTTKAGEVTVRAGEGTIFNAASSFNKIWITKPRFNGFYSRNNLPKIKNEAYVINLDEFLSIGTHWIVLHVNGNNIRESYDAICFDSFKI